MDIINSEEICKIEKKIQEFIKQGDGTHDKETIVNDTVKETEHNVRSNLYTHLSDTPFAIRQPIWRPCLLERVYKPIHTPHWCGVLQSSITESIRDRV